LRYFDKNRVLEESKMRLSRYGTRNKKNFRILGKNKKRLRVSAEQVYETNAFYTNVLYNPTKVTVIRRRLALK
jgi:hypothetical protein